MEKQCFSLFRVCYNSILSYRFGFLVWNGQSNLLESVICFFLRNVKSIFTIPFGWWRNSNYRSWFSCDFTNFSPPNFYKIDGLWNFVMQNASCIMRTRGVNKPLAVAHDSSAWTCSAHSKARAASFHSRPWSNCFVFSIDIQTHEQSYYVLSSSLLLYSCVVCDVAIGIVSWIIITTKQNARRQIRLGWRLVMSCDVRRDLIWFGASDVLAAIFCQPMCPIVSSQRDAKWVFQKQHDYFRGSRSQYSSSLLLLLLRNGQEMTRMSHIYMTKRIIIIGQANFESRRN